jgi:hypothetical protein
VDMAAAPAVLLHLEQGLLDEVLASSGVCDRGARAGYM